MTPSLAPYLMDALDEERLLQGSLTLAELATAAGLRPDLLSRRLAHPDGLRIAEAAAMATVLNRPLWVFMARAERAARRAAVA